MAERKIIIDCDPGHDDAVAIILALGSRKLETLGITVVAGNQTLDKTGRNALNVVQYLGKDVPVARGASRPLVREPVICPAIHGESGLDGFDFPPLKIDFVPQNAVEFMREKLIENDKVTIVATGPETNVATLLQTYPEVKSHIEEIVLMGGSIGSGNVTPAAEFNILADPEAAAIVFGSGLEVKMIGLDVTRKLLVLPEVIERMRKVGNRASLLFVKLMETFCANQKKVFGLEGGPLHDPATIASLLDPALIKFQKMNVEIDLSGGPSYGRTNCDQFDYLHRPKNAWVAVDVDVRRFFDLIEEGLRTWRRARRPRRSGSTCSGA